MLAVAAALILIFSPAITVAQEVNVHGKVSDTRGPLGGVTVSVKRTTSAVSTADDGSFSLTQVRVGDTLLFRLVGYVDKELPVPQNSPINVFLEPDNVDLDEVVVVAYGVQKKATVTGAVSSVSTAELRVSSSPSLANALAGRVAGLTSMQRVGGQPGVDDATMYLRGAATINGTNPLILIDGVPRDNIRTLDINEVESISVLKDASATAIFGVRGANGVLIITTKRGKAGKPELSVNATQSFSRLTREPNMPGSVEYMRLRNMAMQNDGFEAPFSPSVIAKFENPVADLDPSDPDYEEKAALRRWMYPSNNWYKMLVKRWSPQTNVNANMSGGTDRISYFLNVGYLNQGGNMHTLPEDILKYDPSFKMDRYSFRSNVDYKVNSWLSAFLNLGTYIEKVNMPNPSAHNGDRNWMVRDMMYQAQAVLPMTPGPMTIPGFGVPPNLPLDPTYLTSGHYADRSPLSIMNWLGYDLQTRSNLNSSFGLDFNLDVVTPGLKARTMISYDAVGNNLVRGNMNQTEYQAFINPQTDELTFSVYQLKADNFSLSYGNGARYNINAQAQIIYNRSFGSHNVGGMLRTDRDYWDSGGADIPFNVFGVAGRATYDYANRYLAEINFGYNGSEQFSPAKRFGFFPSGSIGWVLSEEPFFQDNPYVSFLKVRTSYGKVGNDKMGGLRFLYLDDITVGGGGFSGSLAAGKRVNEGLLGNRMLTWEVAHKYNLGIDFTIFKDVTGQVDFFREDRSQILLQRASIPAWQGMPLGNIPRVNMGKVRNQGYEIELGYNKQVNPDLSLHFRGQLSYNRNKRANVDEVPRDPSYAYQFRETGYPIGQSWGYLIDWNQDGGYWTEEALSNPDRVTYGFGTPRAGDFVYKDLNGDNVVDDKDQAPIGVGHIPRYSYGFSLSAQWKSFDAYVFFQGLAKFNSGFSTQGTYETTLEGTYYPYHMNAWTEERWANGEKISYPALRSEEGVSHHPNSFFIFDRDLLRLKNFEVGYTLPSNSLRAVGISNMRVFLNGQNVFTWSPKFRPSHLDPENDDSIGYPQTSIFSFGANIKF